MAKKADFNRLVKAQGLANRFHKLARKLDRSCLEGGERVDQTLEAMNCALAVIEEVNSGTPLGDDSFEAISNLLQVVGDMKGVCTKDAREWIAVAAAASEA